MHILMGRAAQVKHTENKSYKVINVTYHADDVSVSHIKSSIHASISDTHMHTLWLPK
jgi:hypothetical protein